MSLARRLAAAAALRVVTRLPSGTVGRARVAGRLAPLLEKVFAVIGSPLEGTVVAIAAGPAEGLKIVGERRSLAWLSGGVERELQAIVESELPRDGVFVDAGASIGFFSLLAARLVGPTGRVIAFEPQPAAAASIRVNADLNSFGQITVVEAALSSASGTGVLHGLGTATARLSAEEQPGGLPVELVSLDDFLAARPGLVPDLVKIDVEGHEPDVLAGMTRTLEDHRPAVLVELHGTRGSVVQALQEAGYAVSVVGSTQAPLEADASAHLHAHRPSSP